MRFYDLSTETEFNKDHPLWKKYVVTKAGKPREHLNAEGLRAAAGCSELFLAPSVTTISNIIDGFGTFGAGAGWGKKMTLQAVSDVGCADVKQIDLRASALMTSARDAGTRGHMVVEGYLRHILDEANTLPAMLAADELEMAREVRAAITKYIDEDIIALEHPCCSRDYGMGGRVDILCANTVIDLKFPEVPRKPKESEIAQVVAYARLLGMARAALFMWDRKLGKVIPYIIESKDYPVHWHVMMDGKKLFISLVDLWLGSVEYSVYLGRQDEGLDEECEEEESEEKATAVSF